MDLHGKSVENKECFTSKKKLGAWIPTVRTTGRPQSNLKDNFIQALKNILKNEISNEAMFKEWLPIAADGKKWNVLTEDHFNKFCGTGDTGAEYAPYERSHRTKTTISLRTRKALIKFCHKSRQKK